MTKISRMSGKKLVACLAVAGGPLAGLSDDPQRCGSILAWFATRGAILSMKCGGNKKYFWSLDKRDMYEAALAAAEKKKAAKAAEKKAGAAPKAAKPSAAAAGGGKGRKGRKGGGAAAAPPGEGAADGESE